MTKTTLAALAAALLAGSTFSTAANAGGVRVGFGFPLGSFVAHSNQNYSQQPSYGYKKSCDKPVRAARHVEREEAPVRKAHRAAPKIEVAEKPEPKKIKRAPKVEVAEEAPVRRVVKKVVQVQTAKLDEKPVVTEAAPTVFVPATPVAAAAPQTTAAPVETAAVTPPATTATSTAATVTPAAATPVAATVPAVKDEAKVEAPKTEKIEKAEKDTPKVKISTDVKRLCRRFSAAIAGLIDVPCE